MSEPPRLDHVFVMCRPGAAAEEAAVEAAGLRCVRQRRHVGQGTANRCYLIGDLMLELLWIDDAAVAGAEPAAGLRLLDRAEWRSTGASPFGIALQPTPDPAWSFSAWAYEAAYLPAGTHIPVARAPIAEPLLFVSPGRWGDGTNPMPECRLAAPALTVLPTLGIERLTCETGPPLLTITMPGAKRLVDLHPHLPVVLRL